LGTGFFVHRRIILAVKRVEFVNDRLSYRVLRGRWRNIILVNVHAPSEESKDKFYEELEQVFDHFPEYHTKILLGDFNAKVGILFANQQLDRRASIRILMIMELD